MSGDSVRYLPMYPFERLMKRIGLSYRSTTILILLLFGVFVLFASWWDGAFRAMPKGPKGKAGLTTAQVYLLQMPLLLAYFFAVFHYLRKWLNRILNSLRPLVAMEEDEYKQLIAGVFVRNRKTQWKVTGAYVLVSFLVLSGWDDKYPALSAYWLCCVGLSSFFVGQLISTLPVFGRQLLKEIFAHVTRFNVFGPGPLHSIADWSVRVTGVFIGAIILGELFVPAKDALSPTHLIINGFLVALALGLHFFMLWEAHLFMGAARKRELSTISARLHHCYQEMHARLDDEIPIWDAQGDSLQMLLAYEERLKQAPVWPQNSAIVSRLLGTLILPTGISWAKKLLGSLQLPS